MAKNFQFGRGTLIPVEARNFVTTAVKEIILSRNIQLNKLSEHSLTAIDEGNSAVDQSLFGLPVWDVVQLRYVDNGVTFFVNLNIAEVTVTQQRNIITTPVQGLDGTIKEFISAGDNEIRIRATVASDAPDYYPGADIQSIRETLDVKAPISVISTVLNKYFDISSVVVTGYNIMQPEPGMRNIQTVEITALTDDPTAYEIILVQ